MITYRHKNGNRSSITLMWLLGLSIYFALHEQWWLHLATIAVGSVDRAFVFLVNYLENN